MIVQPQDVVRTARFVRDALAPGIGMDWSVRAGRLEWDGAIPVQDAGTVVEWVLEDGSWRPVYLTEEG